MATKEVWTPPADPDFEFLAETGYEAWAAAKPDLIAWDTETTGVGFYDYPFCATFAWRNKHGVMESAYIELDTPHKIALAYDMLDRTPQWVGHNLKFDMQKAILKFFPEGGYVNHTLHDTEALAHLDDEHRPKGLKPLAVSVLGYNDTVEVEVKSGPRKGEVNLVPREKHELDAAKKWAKKEYGLASVKDVGYHLIPRAILKPYAVKDAEFTLLLYEALRGRVERFSDLWGLYLQEMELAQVFLEVERHGMGVDEQYVAVKLKEYAKRVLSHDIAIEKIVGMEVGKAKTQFNPNSNPQIADFFAQRNFVRDSYDEENLKTVDHPLAAKLLELRSDQKILNTYFKALKKGTKNGIFHPSIRQHGTVTGRTSSGGAKGDNG